MATHLLVSRSSLSPPLCSARRPAARSASSARRLRPRPFRSRCPPRSRSRRRRRRPGPCRCRCRCPHPCPGPWRSPSRSREVSTLHEATRKDERQAEKWAETQQQLLEVRLHHLRLGQTCVELECRRAPAPGGAEDQAAARGAFFQEVDAARLEPSLALARPTSTGLY